MWKSCRFRPRRWPMMTALAAGNLKWWDAGEIMGGTVAACSAGAIGSTNVDKAVHRTTANAVPAGTGFRLNRRNRSSSCMWTNFGFNVQHLHAPRDRVVAAGLADPRL